LFLSTKKYFPEIESTPNFIEFFSDLFNNLLIKNEQKILISKIQLFIKKFISFFQITKKTIFRDAQKHCIKTKKEITFFLNMRVEGNYKSQK